MSISTLTQLLHEGQSSYLCYDLGRLVQPISNADFAAIEQQAMPYPYPIQGHACFALVFWPKLADSNQDPFLWFLKFPIDERGLLEQSTVYEFITQVITLLGQQVTQALTSEQEQQLQQSPYLFTPAEDKRAALHAQLRVHWQRPPSVHFELAQSNLETPDQWQDVGVQGLHDVCARLGELPASQRAICDNFVSYPPQLRQALAIALEHQQLPVAMIESLASQLQQQPEANELRADLLRSLASQEQSECSAAAIEHVLQQASADEVVICCARLWRAFDPMTEHPVALELLLHAMAQQQAAIFAALLTDLLRLPGLRPHLLILLQRDDLPQQIRQAWQTFTGAR